jgi:hypothetical protein
VTYSTAAADADAALVGPGYDLPQPLECVLLRRGFNDCFAISAPNEARYVFRVSGRRRRGDADVDTETRFLAYLDSVGVPVATAVPARDGQLFCELPWRRDLVRQCFFDTSKAVHQKRMRRRMRERKGSRLRASIPRRKRFRTGKQVDTDWI